MSERKLFTSESVSEGHPDKIADQISDTIFGCYFSKGSRCALPAETAVYTGSVHVLVKFLQMLMWISTIVVRDTIADWLYQYRVWFFCGDGGSSSVTC